MIFFFKYLFCVYNTCDKQFFFPCIIVSSIEFRLSFHIFLFLGITFLSLIELTVRLLFFPTFLDRALLCSIGLSGFHCSSRWHQNPGSPLVQPLQCCHCNSTMYDFSVAIFSEIKKNLHQTLLGQKWSTKMIEKRVVLLVVSLCVCILYLRPLSL